MPCRRPRRDDRSRLPGPPPRPRRHSFSVLFSLPFPSSRFTSDVFEFSHLFSLNRSLNLAILTVTPETYPSTPMRNLEATGNRVIVAASPRLGDHHHGIIAVGIPCDHSRARYSRNPPWIERAGGSPHLSRGTVSLRGNRHDDSTQLLLTVTVPLQSRRLLSSSSCTPVSSSLLESSFERLTRKSVGTNGRGTQARRTVTIRDLVAAGYARGVCRACVICVICRVVASAGAETTLITSSASAEAFSLCSVAAGVAVLAAVARRPRETRATGTVSCPRPMRAARVAPRPPARWAWPAARLGQSARASAPSPREIGPRLASPRSPSTGRWRWLDLERLVTALCGDGNGGRRRGG